jgi:hypothetical protein
MRWSGVEIFEAADFVELAEGVEMKRGCGHWILWKSPWANS